MMKFILTLCSVSLFSCQQVKPRENLRDPMTASVAKDNRLNNLEEFARKYRCGVCHQEYLAKNILKKENCQNLLNRTVAEVETNRMPLGDENVSNKDKIFLRNLKKCEV